MAGQKRTTYRACNLCEAICGLTIEHDDVQVFSIKGDPDDPLSRGHLCPKAMALQDIHSDPDRLKQPMRRKPDGSFEPISWESAFDLVEEKLGGVREKFGDDAIAIYMGNPTVHNYGALLFQRFIKQAIPTKHRFAATSVDQLPHHFAASQMFGHGLFIPIPDIDRTQFMLMLGANPAASNGSLMTAPDVKNRIKAIRERGGQVVLLDPRATETSRLVDRHHFIRPGSDVFLLAAMLRVIFDEQRTRLDRYDGYVKNVNSLKDAVAEFTPEIAERETHIDAETIRQLARELSDADQAVVYGRMGVSTQSHGGLCQWLINGLNLVTGNLDRPGGQMFATPAVPLVGRHGTTGEFGRWHSRVRKLPEFEGELPVSVLAEEMLTPGDGQIRALITNAGNPVLSTPNGTQLDKALSQLDFFVALDIYLNETTRHADLILPSATGLETDHYDLAFNALAVRNVAKYSPQIFQPDAGLRYDWQVMKEIAKRLMPKSSGLFGGLKRWLNLALLSWLTPQRLLNLGLMIGPYGALRKLKGGLTLRRVKEALHGIDLGELQSQLPQQLRTPDRKIDAAPSVYTASLAELQQFVVPPGGRAESIPAEAGTTNGSTFSLIGRRHLRSNNSWMHNSRRLVKGPDRCTLMMHADDATRLSLQNGDAVQVSSRVGQVTVPLEVTDSMMPGVVSLPHGYGHDREDIELSVAEEFAGASINDLTDDQIVDSVTGNAAFSGQLVTVSPIES